MRSLARTASSSSFPRRGVHSKELMAQIPFAYPCSSILFFLRYVIYRGLGGRRPRVPYPVGPEPVIILLFLLFLLFLNFRQRHSGCGRFGHGLQLGRCRGRDVSCCKMLRNQKISCGCWINQELPFLIVNGRRALKQTGQWQIAGARSSSYYLIVNMLWVASTVHL